jgi:hypothetical protein
MIDAAASPITETKEHHHRPFLPQPPVVPTEIHTHPAGSESNRPGDEILAAMTAAATTTRPTACRPTSADTPKHAFALIAPFRPRNSTANNVTLPAQRHNLDLWPVGLASETSRHDFYVSVGAGSQTAVLVHNCGDEPQSAQSGVMLGRQMASEAQMSEGGTSIAGAGSSAPLRAAGQLAEDYGGDAADWSKMTSSSYEGSDGFQFETHWYQNDQLGIRTEFKVNITGGM